MQVNGSSNGLDSVSNVATGERGQEFVDAIGGKCGRDLVRQPDGMCGIPAMDCGFLCHPATYPHRVTIGAGPCPDFLAGPSAAEGRVETVVGNRYPVEQKVVGWARRRIDGAHLIEVGQAL